MINHEEQRKKFQLNLQTGWNIWQRKMILGPSSIYHDSSLSQIGKAGMFQDVSVTCRKRSWQICLLHPLLCQHCNSPIFQQRCLRASLHSAIFSVLPTHPMLKHSSCNSLPHPSLLSATPPVAQVSSAFSHFFYGLSSLPHQPTFVSYLQGKSQHVLLSSAAKQLMMIKDASPFPFILVGFYSLHYSGPSFHRTSLTAAFKTEHKYRCSSRSVIQTSGRQIFQASILVEFGSNSC